MPTYDYRCATNDRVLEVQHRMSEVLHNWGELCERAGIDLGDTPAETPVERLATGGNVISSNRMGSGASPAPSCGMGSPCSSGFCGLN